MTAEPDDPVDAQVPVGGQPDEIAHRLEKIERLRRRGVEPYPYRFDRTHEIAQVRADHAHLGPGLQTEIHIAVAGRMMLKRRQGKLTFATLRDGTGEIQLFVSRAMIGDEAFDAVDELDLGDWIGVNGTVMTTRTGELSIGVERFDLLAKAVRPMPDKWHGLTDTDTRYRQRYADLIVNPEARRTFEIRHAVVASIRSTLQRHGYVEVETPVLHVEAGGAHARPFVTHHNTLDMTLYLRIALELHLKRLIVGGMEKVFEIGRVFRNEGISPRHNPEFTMLELYRAFVDYHEVMELTEELVVVAARDATGSTIVDVDGEAVDLADPWPRVPMVVLVSKAVGVDVHPSQPLPPLRRLAEEHGIVPDPRWGGGKLIEELFEATVEQSLVRPTFVTGHPVEISPLARADRDDPSVTERFELFIGRRELANGYSELNDPVVQRQRFAAEQRARDAGVIGAAGIDDDYLRALEYGMPPTGGLGVGIDRLAMLIAGATTIKEVILFPTLRPEVR